jgi:hypothetical protein
MVMCRVLVTLAATQSACPIVATTLLGLRNLGEGQFIKRTLRVVNVA